MEILRSKEEKRILKGKIEGIEDEFYKPQNANIPCAIIWYEGTKVLIPITLLNVSKNDKRLLRGMIGAEIDFIVLEYDAISDIAIASREDAMKLRASLEIPKLRVNDVVRTRIITVGRKHVIVDFYGIEVVIPASNLRHTFIVNCKDKYFVGDDLIVRIKNLDGKIELSAKDMVENRVNDYNNNIKELFKSKLEQSKIDLNNEKKILLSFG